MRCRRSDHLVLVSDETDYVTCPACRAVGSIGTVCPCQNRTDDVTVEFLLPRPRSPLVRFRTVLRRESDTP